MRISDWSSDVCSSDLLVDLQHQALEEHRLVGHREAVLAVMVGSVDRVAGGGVAVGAHRGGSGEGSGTGFHEGIDVGPERDPVLIDHHVDDAPDQRGDQRGDKKLRSEEHTSELQSLMRISYAVFCLQTNNT